MKIYSCTFTGKYPVGAVALIIAPSREKAKEILEAELTANNLPQTIELSQIEEYEKNQAAAYILLDGEY